MVLTAPGDLLTGGSPTSARGTVGPAAGVTIRIEVTISDGGVVSAFVDREAPASEPAIVADLRRGTRGFGWSAPDLGGAKEEEETYSYFPPSYRAREEAAGFAGQHHSIDGEIDEALAPLHEATRCAGLRPMTFRPPILAALRPYPITQIRDAVAQLVSEVNRRDTDLRSPFGVLVKRAREGAIAAPLQRPSISATAANKPNESDEPVPSWIIDAVDRLTATELAALDAFIAATEGGSLRMPPAMQRAMRLTYLENWLTQPQGHPEHTPSTPQGVPENTTSTAGVHR